MVFFLLAVNIERVGFALYNIHIYEVEVSCKVFFFFLRNVDILHQEVLGRTLKDICRRIETQESTQRGKERKRQMKWFLTVLETVKRLLIMLAKPTLLLLQ
jgi:hypothetical protein